MAPGTMGMTASRMRRPRPCSARKACTPPAASSPSAEPPESAIPSMASTVLSSSSTVSSRVPGPPPRTSIEATAGRSNMMAVTPEATEMSSAWPTRTPGMSVRRFFKTRPSAPWGVDPTDIAAGCKASTAKRHPDHPGEFGFAIGLCEQQHAGIQPAMMHDGILGIARRVQDLQRGTALQRLVDQLAAVHRAGHDHVGEKQVDGCGGVDDVERLCCVGRLEGAVAEAFDLGDHIVSDHGVVLDHQNDFVAALDVR